MLYEDNPVTSVQWAIGNVELIVGIWLSKINGYVQNNLCVWLPINLQSTVGYVFTVNSS